MKIVVIGAAPTGLGDVELFVLEQVDVNYMFGEKGIHLVPYPAQYAIPLFPEDIKMNCLNDLRKRYKQESTYVLKNFDEWIMHHFGPTIRNHFFRPYSRKVWTVEPERMNPAWVGTRVAKLPQAKLEELCGMSTEELEKADFGWGPNAVFTFPKYGGTGAVWKAVTDKLPKKWFHFNCKVNKAFFVFVWIIGVGLKLPMTEFIKKITWLYFPDSAVPFYRVTILSRYVMCECARDIEDQVSFRESYRVIECVASVCCFRENFWKTLKSLRFLGIDNADRLHRRVAEGLK
uniref:Flavin-containing monooxygenase n=1 Tax=Parascaris equorum TaxID=6256 RepID=A0A914RF98_PAREQ